MKQAIFSILISSMAFLFAACGKDYRDNVLTIQPAIDTVLPETLISYESTVGTSAPAPVPDQPQSKVENDKVIPMMNVPTFGYYPLRENGGPLFSKECSIAEDPGDCSTEALRDWIGNRLKNQENGLRKSDYSIQNIVFEIGKDGSVFNVQHIGSSGNTICWPCVEVAVETVKQMPKWTPAMQDGQPINISMKLPLRFEAI